MLERQEGMLNLGSHTRLFMISLFIRIGQWAIPVRTLIGKVPRIGCNGFEKLPLILAPVSTIAVESSLITVQEVWQLLAVMHIARSHTDDCVSVQSDYPLQYGPSFRWTKAVHRP
jgi:hypothetical protein